MRSNDFLKSSAFGAVAPEAGFQQTDGLSPRRYRSHKVGIGAGSGDRCITQMSVEVPNVPARRGPSARSAVRPLQPARLGRGLPLGRNDPPRLAQVALERVIRDLIEQDADPPAGADIPRVKIDVGRFFDHQGLEAARPRHPNAQPPIVAVVLGKHREAALALLDEEAGRAVRHLLERAGKRGADAADPIDLSFPSHFWPAPRRVARPGLAGPG